MKTLFAVLTLLASLTFLSLARGADAPPDATLARLRAKAEQIHSILATFTQEKRLRIVNKPLVSKGRFAFQKPRMLRWEYLSPVRSGFAVDGETGTRWNELSGEMKSFVVQKDPIMQIVSAQMLLWTTLDLDSLSKMFQIVVESDSPAILKLIPHTEGKSPVQGIRITFAKDDSAIVAIEILEQEGDSTTLRFSDMAVNTALDPALFTQK